MKQSIARRIRHKGTVESRHDADVLLEMPGDIVVVLRGVARSVVIACPDGCGSKLTINLDPRAGKAWRAYHREEGFTLYPSIWRDSGCGAHFIVWRDAILWCSPDRFDGDVPSFNAEVTEQVWHSLSAGARTEIEIAGAIDAVPWDVRRHLDQLIENGRACRTSEMPPRYARATQAETGKRDPSKRAQVPWWHRWFSRD